MACRWFFAAVCCACFGSRLDTAFADQTSDPGIEPATASVGLNERVRSALRLELEGNNSDRNLLLQRLSGEFPADDGVRWHLGYVRTGAHWTPATDVLSGETDRRRQLDEYRQLRDSRKDTVSDHLAIADELRQRGMADEARAHLMHVIELDWNNADARRLLGDVNVEGIWMTRSELSESARQAARLRANREQWDPRVARIVRNLWQRRGEAWNETWAELQALRDPDAIPSVEAALASRDEQSAVRHLEWLSGLDAWEAAVALARQAVVSPSAAVRTRARSYLKSRRAEHYVPALVDVMTADPQYVSRLYVTPLGSLVYQQHVQIETRFDVRERNLTVVYGPGNTAYRSTQAIPEDQVPVADQPEMYELVLSHLRSRYGAFDVHEGRDLKAGAEVANDRIVRTLSDVLGANLSTPQECWNWWNNYQEVYFTSPKRKMGRDYEESWAVERRKRLQRTPQPVIFVAPRQPLFQSQRSSCFAAGTLVATEVGAKPIEKIRLGDRVLAQNVDTGELALKPVLKPTSRPPVRLVRITTAQDTIECTASHPFWIDGEGWLYAREFVPGMRFHTIHGSQEIVSIEDSGRVEPAFNLVVADFHTYFVGKGLVMSHDNSPQAPTNALVPGLMPDYATKPASVVTND